MRKNKDKAEFDRPSTIISKDTTIETENITSLSSLQISGEIIGNINVGKSLVITETGKVTGNIKAQFALISGAIIGNIEVKNIVHITSTGKVNGDILCGSIVVDQAATVNGKCTMLNSDSSMNETSTPSKKPINESSSQSTYDNLNLNKSKNDNNAEDDDNIFKML